MKKLITLILAVLLLFCSTVNASALELLGMKKGDTDLDGKITSDDARTVLRCSVGLYIPSLLIRSLFDLNSDGKISSEDARLTLRLAVGLDGTGNKPVSKETLAKNISEKVSEKELDRLMRGLCSMGSRSVIFPKTNKKAADYISQELKKAGLTPEMQTFYYAGIETQNITAVLNKGKKNGKILLLSSHYDCWDGAEGAIDNASGVSALLHTVKLLKESSIAFNCEIRITFFSAEEMGYYGAYHYLSTLSADEKSKLSVFNIDMAGNSLLGGGKMLSVSTNSAYVSGAVSNELSRAIDNAKNFTGNMGENGYYSPVSAGLHDIVPFEKLSIPAVTLSWREIRPAGSYGSDYGLSSPSQIHTKLDTYENFNLSSLTATTKLIINTVILSYTV